MHKRFWYILRTNSEPSMKRTRSGHGTESDEAKRWIEFYRCLQRRVSAMPEPASWRRGVVTFYDNVSKRRIGGIVFRLKRSEKS